MDAATRQAIAKLAQELMALRAAHIELAKSHAELQKIVEAMGGSTASPTDQIFYGEDEDS